MTDVRASLGRSPDGLWSAPGRVNLIGEHTDYNEGFVLPIAVDRRCRVAAAARADGTVRCSSAQFGPGPTVDVDALDPAGLTGWSAYVLGTAWALREAGVPVAGVDLLVDSDVPAGAGLSSSAALTCAVAIALCDLAGVEVSATSMALAAQRAETEAVGAPVGLMDQMAAMHGRAGHALFLDCRTLDHRLIPLPLDELGLRLVVIDTTVEHAHASGEYGARRASCDGAAASLEVPSLRDVTLPQLQAAERKLGAQEYRRARHVVTENARVLGAVDALVTSDMEKLGELMAQSHQSLRVDFEVSVPALDVAVSAAVAAGAIGARMTGGGFGGSVVAVVPAARAAAVKESVVRAAKQGGLARPQVMTLESADGARRDG